jgi:hypothetical protein
MAIRMPTTTTTTTTCTATKRVWTAILFRQRRLLTAFILGLWIIGQMGLFSSSSSSSSSSPFSISYFPEVVIVDDSPQQHHQQHQHQHQQFRTINSDQQFDIYISSNINNDDDGINNVGIISTRDPSFFRVYQEEIDSLNDESRCERYGFKLYSNNNSNSNSNNNNNNNNNNNTANKPKRRRIFFGALVATEPWELFQIVATESYGIYEGMVLVESNRTQNFSPRNLTHYNHNNNNNKHEDIIGTMFGISPEEKKKKTVQIRLWVNEDSNLRGLARENAQRNDILNGWKDLGMQPDDIGILSDIDEVLTRDFLRAIQVCNVIDEIDYNTHRCRPDRMGLRAVTQVYESSPECPSDNEWFHPSVFVGHCIEGIADNNSTTTYHKSAPRDEDGERLPGWGRTDWDESKPYIPLVNGGDFRSTGGVRNVNVQQQMTSTSTSTSSESKRHYNVYTAFHFHNFFTDPNSIRFKYKTYGHPNHKAYELKLDELSADLALMVYCVKNEPDLRKNTRYKRVEGGFESLDPFTPIYFKDADYRRRKQEYVRNMVLSDEIDRNKRVVENRKREYENRKREKEKIMEDYLKRKSTRRKINIIT